MVNIFKQDARMGRLATALGPDILVLMRFEGTDRLNALFDYQVEALATASDLDFDALIGTHATVTLLSHDGSEQPYDGIITEARWLGVGENGHPRHPYPAAPPPLRTPRSSDHTPRARHCLARQSHPLSPDPETMGVSGVLAP